MTQLRGYIQEMDQWEETQHVLFTNVVALHGNTWVLIVWKEEAGQVSPPLVEPVGHNLFDWCTLDLHHLADVFRKPSTSSVVQEEPDKCEKLPAVSQLSHS